MKTRLKRLWHDPVWSKVIATSIIAIASYIGFFVWTDFRQGWQVIGAILSEGVKIIGIVRIIPQWILWLTGIIICMMSVVRVWYWYNNSSRTPQLPIEANQQSIDQTSKIEPWKDYKSDTINDLKWCWEYSPEGKIINLRNLCPHCNMEIVTYTKNILSLINTYLFCESCQRDIAIYNTSFESLQGTAKRFIEKKIRNGSF